MPGAAAFAAPVRSETPATKRAGKQRYACLRFTAALLSGCVGDAALGIGVEVLAGRTTDDANLGHEAAEVLGIVREVVEVRRVEVEDAARRVLGRVARVENDVE